MADLTPRVDQYGQEDQTWLRHTFGDHLIVTLDGSKFPAGLIPSGTPIARAGDTYVPYDPTSSVTTDAGVLVGLLVHDESNRNGDNIPTAVLARGTAVTARLTAITPSFTRPSGQKNGTPILFI